MQIQIQEIQIQIQEIQIQIQEIQKIQIHLEQYFAKV
jgi:hypothetical protein